MGYSNAAYDLTLFEPRRTYRSSEREREIENRKRNAGAGKRTGTQRSNVPAAKPAMSEQQRKRMEREKAKAHEKKVKNISYLVLGIVAALVITLMVMGGVQQHEYTQRIEDATAQLNELSNDYEALRVEYETQLGASAVEEYAVNNIGMQKVQTSQITWVTVERGDIFEVAKPTRGIFSSSSTNDLLSYLG